jgi:hypothetical protein
MIGFSSGSWAQVITNNPDVASLTVVEINPGYLGLIANEPEVTSPLGNPKVTIVTDDGRRWLRGNRGKHAIVVGETVLVVGGGLITSQAGSGDDGAERGRIRRRSPPRRRNRKVYRRPAAGRAQPGASRCGSRGRPALTCKHFGRQVRRAGDRFLKLRLPLRDLVRVNIKMFSRLGQGYLASDRS